jgi:hypothetical protein
MDNPSSENLGQATYEHQHFQPQPRHERPRDERAFDAYGDPLNLPSFEQVAKSMSRSMRMNDFWPVHAERDRQLEAGRQMAAAEGFGKTKVVSERESQIRAGQLASAKEYQSERQQYAPQQNPNEFQQGPGEGFAKKRRNRNRNKNRGPSAGSGPKPFVPH